MRDLEPEGQSESVDWAEYYSAAEERGLNPFFERLQPFLDDLPAGAKILDLGAGTGLGTRMLLDRGFEVTAVDAEPVAIAQLIVRCPEAHVIESRFEDLRLPANEFDLVLGVFSFFFCSALDFPAFWAQSRNAVKLGGLLAGQLLGPCDGWTKRGYPSCTAREMDVLLKGFDFLLREEVERLGKTIQGAPKYWHLHHFVARKKA